MIIVPMFNKKSTMFYCHFLSSFLKLIMTSNIFHFADISDQRLKFFISTVKFDFEKAKEKLDMLYTLRNFVPEIYSNFDPFSDGIKQFKACM